MVRNHLIVITDFFSFIRIIVKHKIQTIQEIWYSQGYNLYMDENDWRKGSRDEEFLELSLVHAANENGLNKLLKI